MNSTPHGEGYSGNAEQQNIFNKCQSVSDTTDTDDSLINGSQNTPSILTLVCFYPFMTS